MIHLINVPRYILTISVFIIFILFSPMIAAAKHIIVVYDVSGSMVRLGTNVYMESKDIRRVNKYLADLLFINASQVLHDKVNDSYIKECDAAYVGKPLYQSGDILTYAEYAERRDVELDRAQVSESEFQRHLPDSMTLRASFYGMVSYLLRAEVEVYDELHRATDDETYWVFVTDGDIDNSGKSDPGISSVLKRLAELEDEFYSPMIHGIFVNNHVRVQVRKLRKRDIIKTVFFATPTKPGESVREIQLTKDSEGQFISETLNVKTHNSVKSNFKLNSVNVEIVDKFNKPLQILKDNKFNVVEVPPISLDGKSPPTKFRIRFPEHPEIAAPGNALKLEAIYNFKSENKIYSPKQPIKYTAVIDSIYVSNLDNPEQQVKELSLNFSEDTYRVDLVVQSESYDKKAFRIDQLQCHVQYKDGRKLCDAAVPKEIELGKPFSVEVAKQDRLDWYGNKVAFEIEYKYNKNAKSATIEMPYKLVGGGTGFPMWLLLLLLVPVLGVVVYLLIRRIRPDPVVHSITLTEVSEAGTSLRETAHYTLEDKATLEFGPRGPNELRFDVGSDAFIRCRKKNLRLFEDADDEEALILVLPETLTLRRGEDDDEVQVRCEIADDSTDEPGEDDTPIIATGSSEGNPLDR